ncbi:DUF6379 domain-containing protein [Nocardioides sp. LS1]|uniref:C-glycoside deglycosidase beta subunit domain-containing protein n=1 Tax=Nocardioides sp. LS1 TaxID=1027620 RepID=UPI000F62459A|nr:DUF6379 domain-containing protein [Nocardioides sp. LS1]GCD89941.1 hypothetical protein NLS1_19470 [Nocardioides sp. LS1]
MFDKYIVCEDSLRTTDDDRTHGRVEVRMPYYRGLGLSMVEGVDLTVDGTPIPAEATSFTVHGNTYPMTELPTVLDDRWEMGEPARVDFTVAQPLQPGEHVVSAAVRLRISYMPVPGGGRDTKTLTLA